MDDLLIQLRVDYPKLRFSKGQIFSWNAKQQTVIIPRRLADRNDTQAIWSLLHEMGHATLQHARYTSDLELVRLEAAAWQQATLLATQYDYEIDGEHIQDCLDSYRDWLHQRSKCPTCSNASLQMDARSYCCYNCNTSWGVSQSRLCRPYRRLQSSQIKEPRVSEALSKTTA